MLLLRVCVGGRTEKKKGRKETVQTNHVHIADPPEI